MGGGGWGVCGVGSGGGGGWQGVICTYINSWLVLGQLRPSLAQLVKELWVCK